MRLKAGPVARRGLSGCPKLLHDLGNIHPNVFTGDLPVTELEQVKDAKAGTSLAARRA